MDKQFTNQPEEVSNLKPTKRRRLIPLSNSNPIPITNLNPLNITSTPRTPLTNLTNRLSSNFKTTTGSCSSSSEPQVNTQPSTSIKNVKSKRQTTNIHTLGINLFSRFGEPSQPTFRANPSEVLLGKRNFEGETVKNLNERMRLNVDQHTDTSDDEEDFDNFDEGNSASGSDSDSDNGGIAGFEGNFLYIFLLYSECFVMILAYGFGFYFKTILTWVNLSTNVKNVEHKCGTKKDVTNHGIASILHSKCVVQKVKFLYLILTNHLFISNIFFLILNQLIAKITKNIQGFITQCLLLLLLA
jgi:hypothetical protein